VTPNQRYLSGLLDFLYRDIAEKERELAELNRRAAALEDELARPDVEREMRADARFDKCKVEKEERG
jgi:hypothetical protein